MQYGVLCLLPPAAMLIFALKTKKSFEALIFGTLVAYLIMYFFCIRISLSSENLSARCFQILSFVFKGSLFSFPLNYMT